MSYDSNPIGIKHRKGMSCMNNGVFTRRMPQRSMRLQERTKTCAAASNAQHEATAYELKREYVRKLSVKGDSELLWNSNGFRQGHFSSVYHTDEYWCVTWSTVQLGTPVMNT